MKQCAPTITTMMLIYSTRIRPLPSPNCRKINTKERLRTHCDLNNSKGPSHPIRKAHFHNLGKKEQYRSYKSADRQRTQTSFRTQSTSLPRPSHRGSLAPFFDIVKTNTIPLGPDASESGLFHGPRNQSHLPPKLPAKK